MDVSFREGVGHCLSVLSKPRLKYFNVCHLKEIARIEVFAPSLKTFKCTTLTPCAIDLACCTVLKYLELAGADLSANYVPIHDLLSKLLYIEKLQLSNCRVADKIENSSSCLKKLVIIDYINFPGAEIDIPNFLHLDFSVTGACNSRSNFSSWNVPKVEEIHMGFSVQSFRALCRAGLKGFLMKLHNYENLNLLIEYKGLQMQNFIVFEKLHAISFSSLNTFLKKAMPEYTLISSRRVENFSGHMLFPISRPISPSLICSSCQSIELLYRKLSSDKSMQFACSDFELVSTEEIDHEMDSVWKFYTASFKQHLATNYVHR